MSFSNIVLQDVTGEINISAGPPAPRPQTNGSQPAPPAQETTKPPAIARNISFTDIHGTVTTNPGNLPDYPFGNNVRPGEGHSCITLNSVGDAVLEDISFDNIHLTFGGGGTADDAAGRELPQIAG